MIHLAMVTKSEKSFVCLHWDSDLLLWVLPSDNATLFHQFFHNPAAKQTNETCLANVKKNMSEGEKSLNIQKVKQLIVGFKAVVCWLLLLFRAKITYQWVLWKWEHGYICSFSNLSSKIHVQKHTLKKEHICNQSYQMIAIYHFLSHGCLNTVLKMVCREKHWHDTKAINYTASQFLHFKNSLNISGQSHPTQLSVGL